MGQEGSSPVDEGAPPKTLETRTLDGLAKYFKDGHVKKIVVMSHLITSAFFILSSSGLFAVIRRSIFFAFVALLPSAGLHSLTPHSQTGAGISTSAGIPDFRSPKTGLYANLARLNLPYAEAVFDISFFRKNPEPFYTLAQELYPGKYRPTVTHSFIRLLHEKGLLLKCFTQNIDCLEREAGVPGESIVEAHGSFARQSCIECKSPYPEEDIKQHISAKTIPRCLDSACGGLVKPEIVFFGEALPRDFFANEDLPRQADLCIVMGTSLTVHPFAGLPSECARGTPRLLINQERVGDLGVRSDDVLLLGDCDAGVRKLAKAVGWEDELEELWAKTDPQYDESSAEKREPKPDQEAVRKSRDEELSDEVDKLTKEIDETLNLSKWHEDRVRKDHLGDTKAAESVSNDEKTLGYDESAGDKSEGLRHVYSHLPKKPSL
ncbi:hypothetical protein MBLNU459_g5941t1 [Dothideomycetes sp. NU459]